MDKDHFLLAQWHLSISLASQAPASYSHHNTLGMTPPLTMGTNKSHTHVYKSHP